MEKLKIAIDPFLGSPLSEEELKNIIGGQMDVQRTCTCNYTYLTASGEKTVTEKKEANSEEACASYCRNMCNNKGECIDYKYVYTAMS